MAMGDTLEADSKTCMVLGGRGFIGRYLVERLLKLGNWIVRVADSTRSPHLEPSETLLSEALSSGRATYSCVDVRNKHQIVQAIEGVSTVFYVDTVELSNHDLYYCYTIIVQGIKNVINACRECKVKRLIYNSSADLVFDGVHDIHNGDESLPYACKFENPVTDFKAQAEALVLFANDIDGLLTCALRPSIVFGPGDVELVPFLVNMAKSGWAKFIVGSENISDFTYVENVAHAHICAEEALACMTVPVAGKVFFITNFQPMKFLEFVSRILEGLGYHRPVINIPTRVVRYIVFFLKWVHLKMHSGMFDHYVSVYRILESASFTRTFNCVTAQKHIGYAPLVTLEEGIAVTAESFSYLARDSSSRRHVNVNVQSKVDKLLGSGEVADILLWRDEKKSFTCFILLVLLHYWFFLSGRTFISSAAEVLLLITVFLLGYGFLPSTIYGFNVPRISSSCFEISGEDMRNSVSAVVNGWSNVIYLGRSLAQGEDWHTFFKVAGLLYFFKLIASHSLSAAISIALVLAFTLFFIYEQCEDEIDGMANTVYSSVKNAMKKLIRHVPMASVSS